MDATTSNRGFERTAWELRIRGCSRKLLHFHASPRRTESYSACQVVLFMIHHHPDENGGSVVIDNEEDPALRRCKRVSDSVRRVHVEAKICFLEQRRETCSLKVSSQLQAIGGSNPRLKLSRSLMPTRCPAPDWLTSMVAPLANERVGATSGIRWFCCRIRNGGVWSGTSTTRAPSRRCTFSTFPGGVAGYSCAVLLRDPNLLDHWSNCFCEDTSCYGVLRDQGLKLAFVPEATNINRESIDFDRCQNFVMRQLLCVRLHHVHWNAIFLTNAGNSLALALTFLMIIHEISAGNSLAAGLFCSPRRLYSRPVRGACPRGNSYSAGPRRAR